MAAAAQAAAEGVRAGRRSSPPWLARRWGPIWCDGRRPRPVDIPALASELV